MTVREYLEFRKGIARELSPQERMAPEDRKLWLIRVRRANREARERQKARTGERGGVNAS